MKIVKCINADIWAAGFFLLSAQVMAASIPVVSFGISDNNGRLGCQNDQTKFKLGRLFFCQIN